MLKRNICRVTFMIALLALCSYAVAGDVRMDSVFSDNMVLQRDMPVPVWGAADPGASITVDFHGQTQQTRADEKGHWQVRLDKMAPGGPFVLKATDGKALLEVKNVLVGDVWLCSGQSNMEYPISKFPDAEAWLKDADYPQIRLFTVSGRRGATARWAECSKETAAEFSAAGFFFGKHLHRQIDVPIGLITSASSGSIIQPWMSREAMQRFPDGQSLLAAYDKTVAELPDKRKAYDEELTRRKGLTPEAVKDLPAVRPPSTVKPYGGLFDNMIAPLVPLALKGVIWYQGESNAMFAQGEPYRRYLPAMINDWREKWGQGDFPFLIVQLPNYRSNSTWPELRESQALAATLPNVDYIVAIDIGESANIHPNNKEEIGKRLALLARHTAYGEDVVCSGPRFKSMQIRDDGKAVIQFDGIGGGLEMKNAVPGKQTLSNFQIAGADKRFVAAKAIIEGSSVIVWSETVRQPVAVRYAWADNPEGCDFFNKEGLPAAPFRTDDWPLRTAPKRN